MSTHVELVTDHGDGTLDVAHGEHVGTCPVAFVQPSAAPADRAGLILVCPACGASSYWPVTGGAEPEMAEALEAIAAAAPEDAPAEASRAARKRRA